MTLQEIKDLIKICHHQRWVYNSRQQWEKANRLTNQIRLLKQKVYDFERRKELVKA